MKREYIADFTQGKHGESVIPKQELIRCRECKHYSADPWGYGNCNYEDGFRRVRNTDFCSWAERKEE